MDYVGCVTNFGASGDRLVALFDTFMDLASSYRMSFIYFSPFSFLAYWSWWEEFVEEEWMTMCQATEN